MTAWGRRLALGYQKQPPLGSWISALLTAGAVKLHLSPVSALFMLGQACVALTAAYVWGTVRLFAAPDAALIAVFVLLGSPLTTVYANQVNQGVILMPLYAATVFHVLRYLQDGRLTDAVAIGVVAGLGIIARYAIGPLLLLLAYIAVTTPAYRRHVFSLRTLAGAVLFGLIVLPHALWMNANAWPLERALTDHAYRSEGIIESVQNFAVSLVLLFALLLLIRPARIASLLSRGPREDRLTPLFIDHGAAANAAQRVEPQTLRPADQGLRLIAVGAPVLMLAASLITRQVNKPLWVVPFMPVVAAWIGVVAGREGLDGKPRLGRAWIFPALSLAAAIGLGVFYSFSAFSSNPSPNVADTGRAAGELQAFWRSKTSQPLRFVLVDSFGPAAVLPLWSPDAPRVVVNATTAPEIAGEVRPTAASAAEIIRSGGMAVLSDVAAIGQPISGLCAADVRPLVLHTVNVGRPFPTPSALAYLPPRRAAAATCPTPSSRSGS